MGDTKILSRRPQYQRTNALSGNPPTMGSNVTQDRFQEAVVVDVVTNDDHPEYQAGGYNVGCIKFRALISQASRDAAALNWAYPLDANMEDFPLKNELVLVFQSLNRSYYMPKMNVGSGPSNQAFLGLESEMGPMPSPQAAAQARTDSTHTPVKPQNNEKNKLGLYFVGQPGVKHLRHWEGDKIIEGRSGHSIRFGASWKTPDIHKGVFQALTTDQAPNLLIRVGPAPNQTPIPNGLYGRVIEDINDDKSSFWMVTDQVVTIRLATEGTAYNGRSVTDFPSRFAGNQIVLNSDRLILNSKSDKVLVHSFKGIHLSTLKDGTWDAEQDFIVRTGRRVSLLSPKIHIGSANSTTERMVLGDTLIVALRNFIQTHITGAPNYVITPVGPGTLNPSVLAAWQTLLGKLDTFLSQDNYVSRTNQR